MVFCHNRNKQSFVQWDMRRAAMKLHTRDQAPKEGKQENKGVSFADWKPSRCACVVVEVDLAFEFSFRGSSSSARVFFYVSFFFMFRSWEAR